MDDGQRADVAAGRAAVLRTFRWDGGHADAWRIVRDADAFEQVVMGSVAPFRDGAVTLVAGTGSPGSLLGGAAALRLGVGFAAIARAGLLFPGNKSRVTSEPDYRG